MNLKMTATLVALPIGLISLLPKSAIATESFSVNRAPVVIAQQYMARPGHRDREAARREALQYEESRRQANGSIRVLIPGRAGSR